MPFAVAATQLEDRSGDAEEQRIPACFKPQMQAAIRDRPYRTTVIVHHMHPSYLHSSFCPPLLGSHSTGKSMPTRRAVRRTRSSSFMFMPGL